MKTFLLKSFTLLCLIMSGSYVASAQTLVVWQKDGSKVSYKLDDKPTTTFTLDELVITTTSKTIKFPLPNILKYTYEGVSTGIMETKDQGINIVQKANEIVVSGLTAGETVGIYATDGTVISSKTSNGKGNVVLSLEAFRAGVYVVKANSVSYKVLVK